MTDPISDFLTRLRNASKAKLDECVMPHSNLKESVAAILKSEGYVAEHRNDKDEQGHKTLVVKMKYVDGAPAITGLVVQKTGHFFWAFAVSAAVVLTGAAIYVFWLGPVAPVTWRTRATVR